MSEYKAVVFDIDGTLSPELSWTALTRELGASVDAHIKIYEDYKNDVTTYEQSKQELIALWQNTGNANHDYFHSIFESLILDPYANEVVSAITKLHPVCLITGSMDLYAEIVANTLHVPEFYANTTLKWDSNGELIDMDYELDQASKKLEQFIGYCLAHNIDPSQTVVIGDGENDIELFRASGHGVAIGKHTPSELVAVAWKNITDLRELPAAINLPSYVYQ